ncbi:hypothetical protein PSTG_15351 [Puccinia striiformis f. sp. tritici PST-78]|uniref:Uncharacterized protein n=3 Tax=Puccinia striiformis TaxID=27350 RepID=A0A0L0UVZ8_9BASI|nr:hypothetical protein PSTG_15351 [Puccinia striiformis f. sp. tritici PST-78]
MALSDTFKIITSAFAVVAGAAAGPGITTVVIKAVGFRVAGVLVRSLAAAWMASMGPVQAGGLFAILQSIGVAGLGPLGIAVSAIWGASAASGLAWSLMSWC